MYGIFPYSYQKEGLKLRFMKGLLNTIGFPQGRKSNPLFFEEGYVRLTNRRYMLLRNLWFSMVWESEGFGGWVSWKHPPKNNHEQGGGSKHFVFSPPPGEMIQFD